MQKGIPEFLKWYDVKFCPQDTILTLDYPLLADHSSLRGADAVYQYIRSIQIEQSFLGAFEKRYIISVLRKYDTEYRDMVENICSVVMMDMVGHMAIGKPFCSGGFSEKEYLQMAEMFEKKTVSGIENIVDGFIRKIVSRYYDGDKEMMGYLCCGAGDIAVRIDAAVQCGGFDKIL